MNSVFISLKGTGVCISGLRPYSKPYSIENVMTPLLMQGIEMDKALKKSVAVMDKVGVADKQDNLPNQLSGGQQQRVSIARAIAHDPKILFADEPTANLDSETSEQVLHTFLELHESGQTIVMVTHEDEYAKLADRIILLSDGCIVKETKPSKKR
jgi:putative ABC transport system ATP-binding protein